ncbi:L domain-like protein [Anaeromyces robustus]|uniref:L domain-like protein n=1 Tax=Anaeromyces robustus TaxID=1754192 RepID=A0A1Y1VYB0_9FUNG|nr:L domain-like protein [Anaeromyces robustus]|eukprot:ORX65996.1 L domain-like protein [Anaeromyces robustus]
MLILFFLINALLIPRIFANECAYFEKAVKYFGHYQDEYQKVTNCCDFSAVTCDNEQNIIGIKLMNINGSFDNISDGLVELKNLKKFESLELHNVYTGRDIGLPSVIFELKNLKTLVITDNFYEYMGKMLTDEFDKLPNLEKLNLSHNRFSGPFPKSLCTLKNLKEINLEMNELQGTMESECGTNENENGNKFFNKLKKLLTVRNFFIVLPYIVIAIIVVVYFVKKQKKNQYDDDDDEDDNNSQKSSNHLQAISIQNNDDSPINNFQDYANSINIISNYNASAPPENVLLTNTNNSTNIKQSNMYDSPPPYSIK